MIEKVLFKINSNEKNKQLIYNIFGALGIKGLSLLISLVSMPLYIKYFNNQIVLGVWFTIISMLSWMLTFDLGLGNGLRNKLVVSLVEKDHIKSKEYISSVYIILFLFSICIILLSFFIFPIINWNSILNISNELINNKSLLISITILFCGIMISFSLKIINSILYALQKSAINNLIALFTNVIPLIYILFSKSETMEIDLIKLSLVHIISICLPLIIATIIVFKSNNLKSCKPNIRFYNFDIAKSIFKLGGNFFVVQIAFMVITATNEVIISTYFGPELVVEYQVYNRLFTIIGSLFTLALSPLWSSVTKAVVEKDYNWIYKINKILNVISIVAITFELLMIPILQFIINMWLGEQAIKVNYIYAVLFAIYGSLFIYNIALTTIANGIGVLKTQLICYTVGAILKIPFIRIFKSLGTNWGIVIFTNILILLIFCLFQKNWLNKYISKMIKTKKI